MTKKPLPTEYGNFPEETPWLPYFTILVPYVSPKHATKWHPTTPVGPFKVLSRGCFKTEDAAIEWAQKHLNGTPYSVKEVNE